MYIFTADSLTSLFVGVLCAAGILNVDAFGYPALALKVFNFILAGLWLVLNYADNQGYDYPLIKKSTSCRRSSRLLSSWKRFWKALIFSA